MVRAVPLRRRGRIAVVTDVGSGMRWAGRVAAWRMPRRRTIRHARSSRTVLTPRRWCHACAGAHAPRGQRWPESPVHRGDCEAAVKPSRREGRVCSARPVVPAACIFFAGGPRARPAPGLPCALHQEGDAVIKARTQRAPRDRLGLCASPVGCCPDERYHRRHLRAERSNPGSFRGGSLDCFVAALLAMTECGAGPLPKHQRHRPACRLR